MISNRVPAGSEPDAHPTQHVRARPPGVVRLDVFGRVAVLRTAEHRSTGEIYRDLHGLGVDLCQRTVTELVHRAETLVTGSPAADPALHASLEEQDAVVLALDSLRSDT